MSFKVREVEQDNKGTDESRFRGVHASGQVL